MRSSILCVFLLGCNVALYGNDYEENIVLWQKIGQIREKLLQEDTITEDEIDFLSSVAFCRNGHAYPYNIAHALSLLGNYYLRSRQYGCLYNCIEQTAILADENAKLAILAMLGNNKTPEFLDFRASWQRQFNNGIGAVKNNARFLGGVFKYHGIGCVQNQNEAHKMFKEIALPFGEVGEPCSIHPGALAMLSKHARGNGSQKALVYEEFLRYYQFIPQES